MAEQKFASVHTLIAGDNLQNWFLYQLLVNL